MGDENTGLTVSGYAPISDTLGEDWKDKLDSMLANMRGEGHYPHLSFLGDDQLLFQNNEYVPTGIQAANLVVDTTNAQFQKTYILKPKFLKKRPTQTVMDQLPFGGATYYQEKIKDVDAEESVWYNVYYPLETGAHTTMKLIKGTHTNLASSDTTELIAERGGEDTSGTYSQKISKVGGYVSKIRYSISEGVAMAERFGAPSDDLAGYLDSVVDQMTRELLSTTVQYGYTFRKIYEGELMFSHASHSIFGE